MSETRDLRAVAQPGREPFFWARLYGRRLSWPITRLFLKLPVSANAVSILSIIVGAAGGVCFAFNTAAWNIAAAALLLLSWVLDCVDGELARVRGTCSLDGEFIDACRHQIVCPALFAGLTLGVCARHSQSPWLLAIGLGSVALSTRFTGGMIDQMTLLGVRRAIKKGRMPEPEPAGEAVGPRGLVRVARWFTPVFVDFNIMHIVLPLVILDAVGLGVRGWTPLDIVHVAYGIAFPIVKLGSMIVAWKQGVSGRVEDVLRGRGSEGPHH